MNHGQTLFGITLAAVLALSGWLLFRLIFGDKQNASVEASSIQISSEQIEESFKKVLTQVQSGAVGLAESDATASPVGAGTGGSPLATSQQLQELEKLRAEVQSYQNTISQLQSKNENKTSNSDSEELLAKIKILEDRLAEYEIIEDDIADLSLFKEENAKLKKELEALKRNSPSEVLNDAAAFIDQVAQEQKAATDVVPAAASSPEPIPTPEPVTTSPLTSDVISKEVVAPKPTTEVALEESVQVTPIVTEAPVATISTTAPVEVHQAPDSVVPKDDVFAEFQGDDNDGLIDFGELDADRMLEEIKDLGESIQANSQVLSEEIDLDKMAKEAKETT